MVASTVVRPEEARPLEAKANALTEVTLAMPVIEVSCEQPLNALDGMVSKPEGTSRLVIVLHVQPVCLPGEP